MTHQKKEEKHGNESVRKPMRGIVIQPVPGYGHGWIFR